MESNYIAWHLPSARWAKNLQTVIWIRRTDTEDERLGSVRDHVDALFSDFTILSNDS
jgi:hypothetical protein